MSIQHTMVRTLWSALAASGLVAVAWAANPWGESATVDRAARLVERGEHGPAARLLLGVVADHPSDARVHYYLGLAYGGLGVQGGARVHLAEAVRLASDRAVYHAALAGACRDAGDQACAAAELAEAIRRAPAEPRYRVLLSGLLFAQGRVHDAVEHARQALALGPAAPDVRLLLADELSRLGDREGTTREYREVVRLAGDGALGEIARYRLLLAGSPATDTTDTGETAP